MIRTRPGPRAARSVPRSRAATAVPVALAALLALVPVAPVPEVLAQGRGAPARSGARPAPEKEKEKDPPPPAEPAPVPYDRELLRLSEVMGALAFLRDLCAAADASEWPDRMKALLDAEAGTQARRERLAGAYNRGYRGYALTYRICTPAAGEATRRHLEEGERLSQAIAGRFGG